MQRSALALALLLVAAPELRTQEADTASRVPRDSVIVRARQLVQSGKDADGRRLLDSLLATMTPDSARYAETLYWHGMLAPTAADAERAYRRLLIESPLSPRAEHAMLQLAQLEQARGDRRGASDHLQRYLLTYPQSPTRWRVSVQLVRLLFDQGPQQLARACDVLRSAQAEVPATAVELRNQLEAQAPRCAYVEVQAPVAAVDSAPPTTATAADSAARPLNTPLPAPAAAPGAGLPPLTPNPAVAAAVPPTATPAFYSVQLGAYDAPEAATRMVQQLVARGIDARVDGAAAPYRVRVGKYTTRADAVKAAADLKAKGHSGFITLVGGAR